MIIDRESPIPLYFQLKRLLLNQIETGELKPGDAFPTEQYLQDTYDLSRTTVRQALGELVDEGRLKRQRGKGTTVAQPKVKHSPESYPNLADHMREQGITPGWTVLNAGWIDPTEEVVRNLNIQSGQQVYCLERLRLGNGEPIGHHLAYVAPEFAKVIDDSATTEGGSLRYLHNLAVMEECIADRTLDAISADSSYASLLDVKRGAALLRITRIVYTQDQRPIEFLRGVYRGDRFQYSITNMRAISHINA